MNARSIETGRDVRVESMVIQPDEQAPCALPYSGLTATEYLAKTISGDIEYERTDLNRSGQPITIYKGEWCDSGLPAGYFWNKHLSFA